MFNTIAKYRVNVTKPENHIDARAMAIANSLDEIRENAYTVTPRPYGYDVTGPKSRKVEKVLGDHESILSIELITD
jgi:hypothetical protein